MTEHLSRNEHWQIGGDGGPTVGDGYFEEGDDRVRVGIREAEYEGEPGYEVYNPATGGRWYVMGIPQGGATREEAVFWAERLASKNGLNFKRPDGWDDVKGALPDA